MFHCLCVSLPSPASSNTELGLDQSFNDIPEHLTVKRVEYIRHIKMLLLPPKPEEKRQKYEKLFSNTI